MDIRLYIQNAIEHGLSNRPGVVQVDPQVESPSTNRATITVRVDFQDGSKLHITERVDTSECYPAYAHYSYQYLSSGDQLLFRYDDSAHHPDVPTFPHHKHEVVANQELIVASERPSHNKLFKEILLHLR